jgi:uncharacterized protein (DUF302 family)
MEPIIDGDQQGPALYVVKDCSLPLQPRRWLAEMRFGGRRSVLEDLSMDYYINRLLRVAFDEAVTRTKEALKEEGFGVLTEINVRETLKAKIGVDYPKYVILGACNPALAHEALRLENKVGTMLPCNVVVRDAGDGQIEVAAIDPVASMLAIDNPALKEAAKVVQSKLSRAVAHL